jgi:hypothetical protein
MAPEQLMERPWIMASLSFPIVCPPARCGTGSGAEVSRGAERFAGAMRYTVLVPARRTAKMGQRDIRRLLIIGAMAVVKPKEALAAISKTITLGGSIDFDAGLALELEAEVEFAGTENFGEGIAAFRAKRQPSWR